MNNLCSTGFNELDGYIFLWLINIHNKFNYLNYKYSVRLKWGQRSVTGYKDIPSFNWACSIALSLEYVKTLRFKSSTSCCLRFAPSEIFSSSSRNDFANWMRIYGPDSFFPNLAVEEVSNSKLLLDHSHFDYVEPL